VALGALFTCVQAYEYSHAAFSFAGHVYGATFFMATGFHGFHVLVGTSSCGVLFRAYAGHFTPHSISASSSPLVLALRRRGVAVPVPVHLCLGPRRLGHGARRALTAARSHDNGRPRGRPFS